LTVLFAGLLPAQVYEGPAILSRGGGAAVRPYGERSGRQAKLRMFVDLSGVFDTGLRPYELDAKGNFVNPGSIYGLEAGVGAFGVKTYRRATVGLDYRGTYRYYPQIEQNRNFNGSDHFLGLDIKNQLTRRTGVEGHVTAGTSNRVFSFGNFVLGNAFATTLPINEVFDNRVYFLQGGASVSFQPTARFSYILGGDGYAIRRNTGQLIGLNGYSPRAGMAYRVSRRLQIGSVYQFQHFDYPRAFGEADVHMGSGILGYDLNKRMKAEFSLGLFNANSAGTRTVAADPVIQRLLGLSSIVESFSRITNRAFYSAILTSRYSRAVWSGGYSRTPGGGNGLSLLSIADTGNFNFSYSADKKLSFGLTTSVNRVRSLSNDVGGAFTTYFAGGSANYFFTRSLGFNTTMLFRHQDLPIVTTLRNSYRIAIGLTWSPGEVGLPVF
jgi:hypothetical protein